MYGQTHLNMGGPWWCLRHLHCRHGISFTCLCVPYCLSILLHFSTSSCVAAGVSTASSSDDDSSDDEDSSSFTSAGACRVGVAGDARTHTQTFFLRFPLRAFLLGVGEGEGEAASESDSGSYSSLLLSG